MDAGKVAKLDNVKKMYFMTASKIFDEVASNICKAFIEEKGRIINSSVQEKDVTAAMNSAHQVFMKKMAKTIGIKDNNRRNVPNRNILKAEIVQGLVSNRKGSSKKKNKKHKSIIEVMQHDMDGHSILNSLYDVTLPDDTRVIPLDIDNDELTLRGNIEISDVRMMYPASKKHKNKLQHEWYVIVDVRISTSRKHSYLIGSYFTYDTGDKQWINHDDVQDEVLEDYMKARDILGVSYKESVSECIYEAILNMTKGKGKSKKKKSKKSRESSDDSDHEIKKEKKGESKKRDSDEEKMDVVVDESGEGYIGDDKDEDEGNDDDVMVIEDDGNNEYNEDEVKEEDDHDS